MAAIDPVAIEGLRKFSWDLKQIDNELPKALRVALNDAANVIVDDARPRVPRGPTGRARKSVKAKSTRSKVRVSGGGNRAPYYPWLDFGGRVGRNNSINRPWQEEGRYLYRAYFDNMGRMSEVLEHSLLKVVESAGIVVE